MRRLLLAIAGLAGWLGAFSTLYALQGLSCALGWHERGPDIISASRLLLVAAFALWIAALLWLCWKLRPGSENDDLLGWLAFAGAITGLVATVYTGSPVLTTSVCRG